MTALSKKKKKEACTSPHPTDTTESKKNGEFLYCVHFPFNFQFESSCCQQTSTPQPKQSEIEAEVRGKQLFLSVQCGCRKRQRQCRNNTANRSLQTNNFCSNCIPRRCRVTQPLPGTGSLVKVCDVNKLWTWLLRFRARWHASSHFSAADMHRQVGLLESSGKTQPAGSLVPALEIPLASPPCAPAEPQRHVCDSVHGERTDGSWRSLLFAGFANKKTKEKIKGGGERNG